MRRICESEELAPFDLVDINMGCPMPKIVKNGEGSALLENLPLAEKVISECVKSGKRISVKFRIGVTEENKIAPEFAKLCEGAGACMIAIHGRTREKIYAGEPDYAQIAAAKEAVTIPVIANGGIWSKCDAEKMLAQTGADGVMIGRAALYRPQIFCELTDTPFVPTGELFSRQLDETKALYGERFATVFMRKMAAFYIKGHSGAAEYKRQLFRAETTEEVAALASEIFAE
jgi:tRNA-dihydrouridine synthase B